MWVVQIIKIYSNTGAGCSYYIDFLKDILNNEGNQGDPPNCDFYFPKLM